VPRVTLIIPTNRGVALLVKCLRTVAALDFEQRAIEVVVVFNGLEAPGRLDPGAWPFHLQSDALAEASICAAKNRALDLARGEWIILLNDDVQLSPGFIQAHLAAHAALGRPALVLGAAPFVTHPDETLFDRLIAESSLIFFYDRMPPRAWYNFRHAWNLNLSFRRSEIGTVRFDERLAPVNFDDIEWAFRLQRERGLRVWYEPRAGLRHDHRYTLTSYLRREVHLGRMAHRLWRCNPACFEAIYGGGLEQVLSKARRFVCDERVHAKALYAVLKPLVSRGAQEFGGSADARREFLAALTVAHRPLKRWTFYRGLLAAQDAGVAASSFRVSAATEESSPARIKG
jgi:hypothetical protein